MKQFSWQFGQRTDYLSEKFTLNSDVLTGKYASVGYITEENENFLMMSYQLKVEESGNALSVIAAYNFGSVMLSLALYDENKMLVAKEKQASLEDIEQQADAFELDNDMTSYIEIPALNEGLYEMQILIRKFLFLPT